MMIVMFYGPAIQMRYLFPVYPLMVMISVYAISRIVELTRKIPESKKLLITILLAFLIFSGQIILKPQNFYQSEFDSPRPDFKNAYGYISENRKEGDMIISPYAHLNRIYLNDKGHWLPISLSGKQSELQRTIVDGGYDYYVYAPIIKGIGHLKLLINNQHGFIVLDGMASLRLQGELLEITDNPNVTQVFHSGTQLNSIWVYRF